jgi:hypothetical protein
VTKKNFEGKNVIPDSRNDVITITNFSLFSPHRPSLLISFNLIAALLSHSKRKKQYTEQYYSHKRFHAQNSSHIDFFSYLFVETIKGFIHTPTKLIRDSKREKKVLS